MAQPQLVDQGAVVASVDRLSPTAMLKDQWNMVKELVATDIGVSHSKSWIEPLELLGLDGMMLVLGSPNSFAKDWVENHYLESMEKSWKQINMVIQGVKIIIHEASVTIANTNSSTISAQVRTQESFDSFEKEEAGTYTGAPLDNRFTFENFVVGKPNELAYAAALRVAESSTPQFNPLFLYGGVGLGKTHLMHAIAWKIRQCHPARKVIYLSAEKFMYQFVRALRYKDMVSFKDQFRAVDVLMIDDVQFISGKDTTQEEFFHTFNALVDKNHQVIVSADKSPSDLENMEERLKSRLGWGLVADIHPTTYELRLGILQAKSAALGVKMPKEVLEFLAFKITSNIRELEGALNRILAHASLVGRSISLDTTQEVLRDLLRSNDQRLTVEEIQRKVAEYFNIKMSDMVSNRRMQNIARPRQIAMYIAKQLTSKSLPEIGRKFGGRDHTTILHAVRKIQELSADDFDFANDVEILKRSLQT
ncbi:MAG: chromosomal replication initiator protein DnaA [Alphaproteobacteria bacterium]